MPELSIYEHLQDFDNAELDHDAWMEQLEEAVENYNAEHGTTHNPRQTVINYINRQITEK